MNTDDVFDQTRPDRRDFLRGRNYKPSVSMTMLTQIPHWEAPDGQIFTEVEAVRREQRWEEQP